MILVNDKGTPHTIVRIYGISKEISQTFEAIIDTGFDGFLRVPFEEGMTLGLITRGIGKSVLADGTLVPTLICLGTVVFEDMEIRCLITLGGGKSVLIGTSLLKKINAKLIIDYPNRNCSISSTNPNQIKPKDDSSPLFNDQK